MLAEQVVIHSRNISIIHILSPDSSNTTHIKFILINKELQYLMNVFQITKTFNKQVKIFIILNKLLQRAHSR